MLNKPNENSDFKLLPPRPTIPSPRQAWVVLGSAFAFSFLIGLLTVSSLGKVSLLLAESLLLLIPLWFLERQGFPTFQVLRLQPISGRLAGLSILIGFSLSLVINKVDSVYQAILPWDMPDIIRLSMEQAVRIQGHVDLVLTLVTVVFGAAFFEETLFRGFLQSSFEQAYGRVWAIGCIALLFGVTHVNPWSFAALLGVGLVFGLLSYASKSIYPSIIGHVINNGLVVLILNAAHWEKYQWLGKWEEVPDAVALISGLVLVVGLVAFWHQCERA